MPLNETEQSALGIFKKNLEVGGNLEVNDETLVTVGINAALRMGSVMQMAREELKRIDVKTKPDGSRVTNIDIHAEEIGRALIKKSFPQHVIIGEEKGGKVDPSKYSWAIDPIDSTNAFLSHENTSAVSIALYKGSEVVLGVIYSPFSGELYYACNDNQSRLLRQYGFSEETIGDNLPLNELTSGNFVNVHPVPQNQPHYNKLAKARAEGALHKIIQTGGSPALSLASAAKGHFVYVHEWDQDQPTAEWDLAAGEKILKNAGGRTTDINGQEIVNAGYSGLLIAGINNVFHGKILEILRK